MPHTENNLAERKKGISIQRRFQDRRIPLPLPMKKEGFNIVLINFDYVTHIIIPQRLAPASTYNYTREDTMADPSSLRPYMQTLQNFARSETIDISQNLKFATFCRDA